MAEPDLAKCQEIIDYEFSDPELLRLALTHASAAPTRVDSNERLEFLGDAVLGLVICQQVYGCDEDLLEGAMTKVKSAVVSRQTCSVVADGLGLTELLVVGRGFDSLASLPSSLGAATFEAVIGAIFLDGGFEPAKSFIIESMDEALTASLLSEHQRNYKSLLQQHAQRQWNMTPQYELLDEKGPEHAKCFEVAVRLNGREFPSAWGNAKKQAEQGAALAALAELGLIDPEAEAADAAEPPQ